VTHAGSSYFCRAALLDGTFRGRVRVLVADGVITAISADEDPDPTDVELDTVVPGFGNAHSHAFHRRLRGRTHADGGDFWQWRERMYAEAADLDPDRYHELAETVFTEMRDAGYTAVGEFHYVHHSEGGEAYADHAMELALAAAAESVGIRLVLLDACYLRGGIGQPLSARQRRFGDGDVQRWLERWHALRDALRSVGGGLVTVGAAIHSVRAVSRDDLTAISAGLPPEVPLHAHISEQRAENDACFAAYGLTPVGLLAEHGLISPRFSAVHATHLTEGDIRQLGTAGATVVMCPTTEADLGDGIGPAPELLEAGARLAIGSDQHVVLDPLEELTRLEYDQRLRSERRGVFTPEVLWRAGTVEGYRALGLVDDQRSPGLRVGNPFDAVELDAASPRTAGAEAIQLPVVARSADIRATIVAGRLTRPTSAGR